MYDTKWFGYMFSRHMVNGKMGSAITKSAGVARDQKYNLLDYLRKITFEMFYLGAYQLQRNRSGSDLTKGGGDLFHIPFG